MVKEEEKVTGGPPKGVERLQFRFIRGKGATRSPHE